MGFFNRFRKKTKTGTVIGITGHPVNAIEAPAAGPSPHPDHYDRERNASRIRHLRAAIEQWEAAGWPKEFPKKYEELKAELEKHLRLHKLFHSKES